MIDAQAVLTDLEKLQASLPKEQDAQSYRDLEWVQDSFGQLPVERHRDVDGNAWFTLPGSSATTVVLGSYGRLSGDNQMDRQLGLICAVESMKALARRYEGLPPCRLQLVVWAKLDEAEAGSQPAGMAALVQERAAAYLELHVEAGSQLEEAGTPLGVVTAVSGTDAVDFHPRLIALCDEAIRELTGTSVALVSDPAQRAVELARLGVPSALMCVRSLREPVDGGAAHNMRLDVLQAAEAFGRWVEATVHLVTGDDVDLWAREHRMPHSS